MTFKAIALTMQDEGKLLLSEHIVFFINRMSGTDQVVKWCPIPINGSIAYTPGIHKIVVESKGDYVLVSN